MNKMLAVYGESCAFFFSFLWMIVHNYLAAGVVVELCWRNVMFVDEKHGIGATNVLNALREPSQFICVAVNPCFSLCWVFDEVLVLQTFSCVSVSDRAAQ